MKRKKKMGRCVTQSEFNNKSCQCHVISHKLFYYYNNIINAYIYHYRPQTSLIQMWFWISCVILVCWRRWRSAELDFRCAARLKISSAGLCVCVKTLSGDVWSFRRCALYSCLCVSGIRSFLKRRKRPTCVLVEMRRRTAQIFWWFMTGPRRNGSSGRAKWVTHQLSFHSLSHVCVCVLCLMAMNDLS